MEAGVFPDDIKIDWTTEALANATWWLAYFLILNMHVFHFKNDMAMEFEQSQEVCSNRSFKISY